MSQETQPTLPGGRELLTESWAIYKKSFGKLFAAIIIPALAVLALFLLVALPLLLVGGFTLFSSDGINATGITAIIAAIVISTIVLSVVQAWSQAALILAIDEHDKKSSVSEILNKAWSKVRQYWIVVLLTGFLTLGGFMLFFIPGFIFSIWFTFALYIAVLEKEKGMDALLKSKKYIEGRFWEVLGRLIVPGLISFAISLLAGALFGFSNDNQSAGDAISSLISFVLTPLFTAYYYLLYKEVKRTAGDVSLAGANKAKGLYITVATIGTIIFLAIAGLIIVAISSPEAKDYYNDFTASPTPTPTTLESSTT
jgi:hypothetical protein